MNLKMNGLSELTKQLDQATRVAKALDGQIASVEFDPSDQSSVAAAILEIERAIDAKLAPFRGNPLVSRLSAELKQIYARDVRGRAQTT